MATRNDVARLAGVSTATVSRVVNKSNKVSPETAERVEAAIKELGYVPNVMAKSLRTRLSYTVAFVVHDVTNPFFGEIFRGICDVAAEQDYFALIYQYIDSVEYFMKILQKSPDAIITFSNLSDEVKMLLDSHNVPVFYLGSVKGNTAYAGSITVDFEDAAYKMVNYLFSLGHRNIALIGRSQKGNNHIYEGYRRAFNDLNLCYSEENVEWFDSYRFIVSSGYECMKRLLKKKKLPTAVVCNSDWVAVGAVNAIFQKGLKVPDDISVVGFDDLPVSAYLNPPLTTAKTEGYEEGRLACHMVIDCLNGKKIKPVKIKCNIIERKSVKRL